MQRLFARPMADRCILQVEMWGKLYPSNRGRRGGGKPQMHSLVLDDAEIWLSKEGLARTIIGRDRKEVERAFVRHLLAWFGSRAVVSIWGQSNASIL